MQRPVHAPSIAVALAAALLSACGAGAGGDGAEATPARLAAYQENLAYCGASEPVGGPAQSGGWEMTSPSRYDRTAYDVNALVSPAGAGLNEALRVGVTVHDYRGITGTFIPAGYVEPEWKMGVILSGALPVKTAACVVSLAKVIAPPALPVIPGIYQPPQTGNTLSWRSKWMAAVPVETVPGTVIDGFEYVSTFDAPGGQVFFVLSKSKFASAAGLSICYLPPAGGSWDCAAASSSDLGKDWGLARRGVKAGMVVAMVPKA